MKKSGSTTEQQQNPTVWGPRGSSRPAAPLASRPAQRDRVVEAIHGSHRVRTPTRCVGARGVASLESAQSQYPEGLPLPKSWLSIRSKRLRASRASLRPLMPSPVHASDPLHTNTQKAIRFTASPAVKMSTGPYLISSHLISSRLILSHLISSPRGDMARTPHVHRARISQLARMPLFALAIFPSPELACSARLLPTSPQHQPTSTTTPALASRTSSASPTAGPGVVKPAGSGACDEPAWRRSTMWAISTMWTMANAVSHAHWAVR